MNKYKEYYIERITSERFMGWVFVILVSIVTIIIWIFGAKDLWPLKNKIILTIVGGLIIYCLGYLKIKKANKELKEALDDENK